MNGASSSYKQLQLAVEGPVVNAHLDSCDYWEKSFLSYSYVAIPFIPLHFLDVSFFEGSNRIFFPGICIRAD